MKATLPGILTACLGASLWGASSNIDSRPAAVWNQKAAAAYLDRRADWWMAWPATARGEGTFCISCHTAMPYVLARPHLRRALSEEGRSSGEQRLLANVAKRVRSWKTVQPFYGDEQSNPAKAVEGRGSEAVLNALILAIADSESGRLSSDTRAAFDNLWALQRAKGEERGGFPWLNMRNEPWEAQDSQYYGAALAAAAVGIAPDNYRATAAIQGNLKQLREYLDRQSAGQAPIHRVVLLWASTQLPGLITPEKRSALVSEILGSQRTDGGWSLASLGWTWKSFSLLSLAKLWVRSDGAPLSAKSDGYATGLAVLALQQTGMRRDDARLQRGLAWLVRNQDQKEGLWRGYSLNKHHPDASGTGLFMSDAATAYAVLALTEAGHHSDSKP